MSFCGKSLDEKYSKRNYFENEYTNSSEEIIESNFNVMDEKTYSFENSEEKKELNETDLYEYNKSIKLDLFLKTLDADLIKTIAKHNELILDENIIDSIIKTMDLETIFKFN